VWISPRPDGHLQATGRDERGRKQYRSHPNCREIRDLDKFDRMIRFAEVLGRVRKRVEADIARPGMSREKVLAVVASLLDRTLIRVGNSEYARSNESYGLTTLKDNHVDIRGPEVRFHFKGKSGKTWELKLKDRRIARIVRSIQDLPGQALFQYKGDDQELHAVESQDVNNYLREISGEDISSKDFRTWAGTVLAAVELSAAGPFSTQREAKTRIRKAIGRVAMTLGNTVAVCRKCYVHPAIIECYLKQDLPSFVNGHDLSDDEPDAIRQTCERIVKKHLDRVLSLKS
jgi:DNA topoisomerase-1